MFLLQNTGRCFHYLIQLSNLGRGCFLVSAIIGTTCRIFLLQAAGKTSRTGSRGICNWILVCWRWVHLVLLLLVLRTSRTAG